MTNYEYLEDLAEQHGIVIDYSLLGNDDLFHGLYLDFGVSLPKVILINSHISRSEQLAVLAEELGHHFASYGDIIAQKDVSQRKQEYLGRAWAYEHLIPPDAVFTSCIDGEGTPWELAEKFDLPEMFVHEALKYYARKFERPDVSKMRIHACRLPA